MRAWIVTYYVATRFDQMQEKTRHYSASLSETEVRATAANFLSNLKRKGIPVYPQFDLSNELVA